MKKIRTVLIGLGTVNIGVLKILIDQQKKIRETYHVELVIVGVADSSGVAVSRNGYSYEELLELKARKKHVVDLKGFSSQLLVDTICEHVDGELLIESSPGNLKTGNPGLQIVKNALSKGWSVVLANKAPLVFGFDELHQLANSNKVRIAFSATVCGGLPVINMLQRDLKLAKLKSLKGIFNATSNYILKSLEGGGTFEDAIKEAQRLGAAEADPSHDVNGHDTANKLFIIMKSFTNFKGSISDIAVQGIQGIGYNELRESRDKGFKVKLVASAEDQNGDWKLSVKPMRIEANSFLGTCDGWEMGLELKTDLYESIALKNYEADPLGTSAAVLRDVLEIVKE